MRTLAVMLLAIATVSFAACNGAEQNTDSRLYRNEQYGYQVTIPYGWRPASRFMAKFAEVRSVQGRFNDSDSYSVLTSLSEAEEEAAVKERVGVNALGLEPWFGFSPGDSVHIFPLESLFPGISQAAFVADVEQAGIIRSNTSETKVTIVSAEVATRLTRRESDDNGDFTYDLVLADIDATTFVIRIVKNAGYSSDDFETIFRSFRGN